MSRTTTTQGVEDEYEHLQSKKRERRGNVETGRVQEVHVGPHVTRITVGFAWTTDAVDLYYDLDDDRDVLKLDAIAEAKDLEFGQVGHLEGMDLEMKYTGENWVPVAHVAHVDGEGSAWETFRTELQLLARSIARSPRVLRSGVDRLKGLGSSDLLLGAVAVKKVIVALAILAIILWLVL